MSLSNFFPMQNLSQVELCSLAPLFVLAFGALTSLLLGTNKNRGHEYAGFSSIVSILIAIVLSANHVFDISLQIADTLLFTPYTRALGLMILFFALIGTFFTIGQDKKEGLLSEVFALIQFATAGMVLMVSTTHLLFMFIALEIMSLAIYVLVSMRRTSRYSAEAGLKYFILGGLASAFFLYGASLIFGSTGTFDLVKVGQFLQMHSTPSYVFYIGLALIIAAMLFKIGAFPFHGWIPDVYQGASTSVTGFMGAAVKFTAFMAFIQIVRNIVFVPELAGMSWVTTFLWLAAAGSMIYGNFVAISQTELKRMLSYSTVAHSGYLILGLVALKQGSGAVAPMVIYLFFYALANLGVFSVIALFEVKNQKDLTLDQISGLGMKHPLLGGLFSVFLLSMAGIPLTSGFIGKYGLFSSAAGAGEIPLVVIAVLTSVVSVFYYLRVIVYLFMKEATSDSAIFTRISGASFAALVSAAATLQFGLFPRAIMQFIKMLSR